jgi:hypothetical protein
MSPSSSLLDSDQEEDASQQDSEGSINNPYSSSSTADSFCTLTHSLSTLEEHDQQVHQQKGKVEKKREVSMEMDNFIPYWIDDEEEEKSSALLLLTK